ncbi:MAG: hypothetical protein ACI9HK_003902 [Pirellulaceae bacterium]
MQSCSASNSCSLKTQIFTWSSPENSERYDPKFYITNTWTKPGNNVQRLECTFGHNDRVCSTTVYIYWIGELADEHFIYSNHN